MSETATEDVVNAALGNTEVQPEELTQLEPIAPTEVDLPPTTEPEPEVSANFQAEMNRNNDILDMLMARIGDVNQQSPYCKIFIYGLPGVGKSTFLGTAPDNLIIDVEEGAKSIANHPELIKKNRPQSLEFRSVFQVEQLINFLAQHAEPLEKFKIVSLDSYNKLIDKALTELIRKGAAEDASRNPYLPQGTDNYTNSMHMKQLADDLKGLDRHIVFLCHAREIKDENTGKVLIRPMLSEKILENTNGMFDLVGFLSADVTGAGITNQRLQVYPTPTVLAKTRIGGLPAIIENPTLTMILNSYEKARQEGMLK